MCDVRWGWPRFDLFERGRFQPGYDRSGKIRQDMSIGETQESF